MKRSLELNLTQERADTIALVDRWTGQQIALRHPLTALYAVKTRLALDILKSTAYDSRLSSEAAMRGMTQPDLCRLILQRASEEQRALLALEDVRIRAKAEVQQAKTQEAIRAVAARFT